MRNPLLQSVKVALQAGRQAAALAEIEEIARFLESNRSEKICKNWDFENIMLKVAYNIAKQTIVVVRDKSEEIQGIVTWNICHEKDIDHMQTTWMPDDADGDCVLIPTAVARTTDALKQGALDMLMQCPALFDRKIIMPRMRKGGKQNIETDINLFRKILKI